MTLNVTLPVSPAAPAASPATASNGNAATSTTKTDPTASSSNTGSPATSSSASVQPSASAASDSAANAASDADLFARMLGAQMDSLTALPQTSAPAPATVDASADKPAKTALPQSGATTDPALLLNSALAALQMPIVQPKQQPQPATTTPASSSGTGVMGSASQTSGTNINPLLSGASNAMASSGAQVASGTDAKFAAETDKLAFEELARAAIGRQDAASLQKLPQDGAVQPTILPQSSEQKVSATPEKSATAVPSFDVEQHMGTPAWSKAIGEHVMTMVSMKAEGARIQISPPQLGPIEVTLKMDAHNNAQLTFTADSAATRAALENSLPKLHTMMAASGIQLGDAQVSSGQSQRQQQQSAQQNRFNAQPEAVEGEEMDTLASIKAARGVLSIFA